MPAEAWATSSCPLAVADARVRISEVGATASVRALQGVPYQPPSSSTRAPTSPPPSRPWAEVRGWQAGERARAKRRKPREGQGELDGRGLWPKFVEGIGPRRGPRAQDKGERKLPENYASRFCIVNLDRTKWRWLFPGWRRGCGLEPHKGRGAHLQPSRLRAPSSTAHRPPPARPAPPLLSLISPAFPLLPSAPPPLLFSPPVAFLPAANLPPRLLLPDPSSPPAAPPRSLFAPPARALPPPPPDVPASLGPQGHERLTLSTRRRRLSSLPARLLSPTVRR